MPIIPAHKVPKASKNVSIWHKNIFDLRGQKMPVGALAVFCRKAAFLFGSGLNVEEVLIILNEQSPKRVFGTVVVEVHKAILRGESLSYAMKLTGVFPKFMCGYIAVGEQTAKLPEIFTRLADYYESSAQTEKELTAALMYPAVVALMMFGVIIMAVTLVLPGYAAIFEASGVALPRLTSGLISVSNFLMNHTLFVVAAGVLFVVLIAAFFRSKKGKEFVSFLWVKSSLGKQGINWRLSQVLSLLLSSGITITDAIPICNEVVDNHIVQKDLFSVAVKINSGVAFWRALEDVPYVNPLFVSLSRVGEDTGNLSHTITKCNTYFEEAYKHSVRRLNKLIEPLITLVLGVVLAAVMISIILPTFELATAI